MLKKATQQGRSKRRGEAYSVWYVEPLSAARTPLADFFSILLYVAFNNDIRPEHPGTHLSQFPGIGQPTRTYSPDDAF